MMGRLGEPIITIDPGPLTYLWTAFQDMGPANGAAMGVEPWDWVNVKAFADTFLDPSDAWEVKTLRAMSRAYVSALQRSGEPLSMSPVQRELGEDFKDLLPTWWPGEAVALTLPELD